VEEKADRIIAYVPEKRFILPVNATDEATEIIVLNYLRLNPTSGSSQKLRCFAAHTAPTDPAC